MSATVGGRPQFALRLGAEGAAQVEAALRQVQDAAARTGAAMQQAGESTGRALVVIERGTQAASAGLTKMGGDAAALVPMIENAGGAVGRLVTALGSGAGLASVLGAAGVVVASAVTLYQNWDTVTRGVGAAYDFLTGRVRVAGEQISATNALLRDFQRLSETSAAQQVRGQVEQQSGFADRAQQQMTEYDRQIATLRAQIDRGRAAADAAAEQQRLARAAGLPQVLDTGDPVARQRALEAELRVAEANRGRANQVLRQAQGNVAALGEAAGTVINPQLDPNNDPNLPRPPEWQDPQARGGGGGGAARQVNEALREREQLIQRNMTADERYAQGLSRIAELNDRLIAQGNDPLPDEVVQREATRLMEEYERATRNAAEGTRGLADSSKEFAGLVSGAMAAVGRAVEDLTLNGKSAGDVFRRLEQDILRLGTRALVLKPLEDALNRLVSGGGAGGGATGGGLGGAGGAIANLLGSFFGGGGGAKLSIEAAQAAGTLVSVYHDGGVVGSGGVPQRLVPSSVFHGAPRYHSGGLIGPDERPVIAQVGERVLNRQEAAEYARGGRNVTININGVRDPDAFRQSQSQITASLARALGRSGRNR